MNDVKPIFYFFFLIFFLFLIIGCTSSVAKNKNEKAMDWLFKNDSSFVSNRQILPILYANGVLDSGDYFYYNPDLDDTAGKYFTDKKSGRIISFIKATYQFRPCFYVVDAKTDSSRLVMDDNFVFQKEKDHSSDVIYKLEWFNRFNGIFMIKSLVVGGATYLNFFKDSLSKEQEKNGNIELAYENDVLSQSVDNQTKLSSTIIPINENSFAISYYRKNKFGGRNKYLPNIIGRDTCTVTFKYHGKKWETPDKDCINRLHILYGLLE